MYMSSTGGPQFPMKMGTQGSLKYYENRDLGPHFPMKMETKGPQFGGYPFSHDTGHIQDIAHTQSITMFVHVSCQEISSHVE